MINNDNVMINISIKKLRRPSSFFVPSNRKGIKLCVALLPKNRRIFKESEEQRYLFQSWH